jgi:cellobiose phosphorylase
MYRIGLEAILGFTKRGDRLTIAPRVPADWPELTVEYRLGGSHYVIVVRKPAEVGRHGAAISVDGVALDGQEIPLVDDGARHEVLVRPRTADSRAIRSERASPEQQDSATLPQVASDRGSRK